MPVAACHVVPCDGGAAHAARARALVMRDGPRIFFGARTDSAPCSARSVCGSCFAAEWCSHLVAGEALPRDTQLFFRTLLDANECFLATTRAGAAGSLLGIVAVERARPDGPRTGAARRVHSLCVDPDWQGAGVGSVLMGHVLRTFGAASALTLNVARPRREPWSSWPSAADSPAEAELRRRAARLVPYYESFGFHVVDGTARHAYLQMDRPRPPRSPSFPTPIRLGGAAAHRRSLPSPASWRASARARRLSLAGLAARASSCTARATRATS